MSLATLSNLNRAALAASQAYGLHHPITAALRAEIARKQAARDTTPRPQKFVTMAQK